MVHRKLNRRCRGEHCDASPTTLIFDDAKGKPLHYCNYHALEHISEMQLKAGEYLHSCPNCSCQFRG